MWSVKWCRGPLTVAGRSSKTELSSKFQCNHYYYHYSSSVVYSFVFNCNGGIVVQQLAQCTLEICCQYVAVVVVTDDNCMHTAGIESYRHRKVQLLRSCQYNEVSILSLLFSRTYLCVCRALPTFVTKSLTLQNPPADKVCTLWTNSYTVTQYKVTAAVGVVRYHAQQCLVLFVIMQIVSSSPIKLCDKARHALYNKQRTLQFVLCFTRCRWCICIALTIDETCYTLLYATM